MADYWKTIPETYKSWGAMLQRCQNPNNPRYKDYGGRGITVCERWQLFIGFLEEMGERPKGLQLERLDNDAGYHKGNCVWATSAENNLNKRKYKNNTSGIKGISWMSRNSKWVVHVRTLEGRVYVGSFHRLEAAIEARSNYGTL